jgi:hypothetical protein
MDHIPDGFVYTDAPVCQNRNVPNKGFGEAEWSISTVPQRSHR